MNTVFKVFVFATLGLYITVLPSTRALQDDLDEVDYSSLPSSVLDPIQNELFNTLNYSHGHIHDFYDIINDDGILDQQEDITSAKPAPQSTAPTTTHTQQSYEVEGDDNNNENVMRNDDGPHRCPHVGCDKAFKQKSHLTTHIRTHTGEKPFKCPHAGCDFASAYNSNLKTHIRSHTGEKTYKCTHDGCDFASAYSSNLTTHIRIHTGEKPFKCTYTGCNKAFTNRNNLKNHMKTKHSKTTTITHTQQPYEIEEDDNNNEYVMRNDDNLYRCPHEGCDFASTYSNNVTKHIRTHTGERPFKCPHAGCNFASARKDSLTEHLRTHTGEKTYKCTHDGCNLAFKQRSSLMRHMKKKHPELNDDD